MLADREAGMKNQETVMEKSFAKIAETLSFYVRVTTKVFPMMIT